MTAREAPVIFLCSRQQWGGQRPTTVASFYPQRMATLLKAGFQVVHAGWLLVTNFCSDECEVTLKTATYIECHFLLSPTVLDAHFAVSYPRLQMRLRFGAYGGQGRRTLCVNHLQGFYVVSKLLMSCLIYCWGRGSVFYLYTKI